MTMSIDTLDEFQQRAKRTLNPTLDARARLLDASIGLAEESAEFLGLVRKRVFQQREIDDASMVEELGDALWCLAVAADCLGVRLSRIAELNQAKLRRRHPDGFRGPEDWSRGAEE